MPRQICMYLARNLTKHSLEEIGGHLGGRDHTTVMHACSKISEADRSDPQMHTLLAQLTKQITQVQTDKSTWFSELACENFSLIEWYLSGDNVKAKRDGLKLPNIYNYYKMVTNKKAVKAHSLYI